MLRNGIVARKRAGSTRQMIKDVLILTIFPGAMVCAAATDLLTMTLPNRLLLALVACFFVVATLTGLGWYAVGLHVILALAAFAVTSIFFSVGWIGGGDVKLFAGTCLWIGPAAVFTYSIYVMLIGFGLTLLLLLWRGLPLPRTLTTQNWLVRLHSSREGAPYGIALAAAGLLVYPATPFVAALGG
jgi:prepilin peptidase CpaA